MVDPLSKPMVWWRSRLGRLVAEGAGDDDSRVRECRAALSYYRIRKVVDAEAGRLSAAGVDLLTAQLLGVAR